MVNSILLCKNCHTAFDGPEPGCTVIPTDLDYFIQFEKKDYERRQAMMNESYQGLQKSNSDPLLPPRRQCPTAGDYLDAWVVKEPRWPLCALGGAYTRYTMPNFEQRPNNTRLQAWHGAPIAAILHAVRAVLGNLTPPEFVPPRVKKQLRELHSLYERDLEIDPVGNKSASLRGLSVPHTRASASLSSSASSPSGSLRTPIATLGAENIETNAHYAQQRPADTTRQDLATFDQNTTIATLPE